MNFRSSKFCALFAQRGEGGGRRSENNEFKNKSLQIQFYHGLWVPWDAQSSRNRKGTVPMDFNSSIFYALFV